ncbi:MAG: YqeG family HAD IIIA-type phosphatase [Bacillota bacterium]
MGKSILMPDLFVDSIMDIPLELLTRKNTKGIIFDLDNTVTEWNNPEIKHEILQWFHELPQHGITACLLSNNKGPRVMDAAEKLGIPYVAKATKPRRRAFRRAMEVLKTLPEETVVVGDQIFTDILGGNRMGLYTVLVSPISKREFIGTRMMRLVERFALRKLKKMGR